MRERDAVCRQLVDQREHLLHRFAIRRKLRDLRSDVDVDPAHRDRRERRRVAVQRGGLVDADAELALLEARRDVGMRARIDVGVHAKADRRHFSHPTRDGRKHRQLGGGFDVEAQDVGSERLLHFGLGLPDPREDDATRVPAGGNDARELAAGHDVETAAEAREDVEHAEVRVGFHGVAHKMRLRAERFIERAPCGFEHRAGIDEARRIELRGERGERHAFGAKRAVRVGESVGRRRPGGAHNGPRVLGPPRAPLTAGARAARGL